MALVALQPAPGMAEDELLRLGAALEQGSTHPLALAMQEAAKSRGIASAAVEAFENHSGQGVSGTVAGRALRLGTPEWLETQRRLDCASESTTHAGATWVVWPIPTAWLAALPLPTGLRSNCPPPSPACKPWASNA